MAEFTQLAANTAPPAIAPVQNAPLQTERIDRAARGGDEAIAALSRIDQARQRSANQADFVRSSRALSEVQQRFGDLHTDMEQNADYTRDDTLTNHGKDLNTIAAEALDNYRSAGGGDVYGAKLEAKIIELTTDASMKAGQYVAEKRLADVNTALKLGIEDIAIEASKTGNFDLAQMRIDVLFEMSDGSHSPPVEENMKKAAVGVVALKVHDAYMFNKDYTGARAFWDREDVKAVVEPFTRQNSLNKITVKEYDAKKGEIEANNKIVYLSTLLSIPVDTLRASLRAGNVPRLERLIGAGKDGPPAPPVTMEEAKEVWKEAMKRDPTPGEIKNIELAVAKNIGLTMDGAENRGVVPGKHPRAVAMNMAAPVARKILKGEEVDSIDLQNMDIGAQWLLKAFQTGVDSNGQPTYGNQPLVPFIQKAYDKIRRQLPPVGMPTARKPAVPEDFDQRQNPPVPPPPNAITRATPPPKPVPPDVPPSPEGGQPPGSAGEGPTVSDKDSKTGAQLTKADTIRPGIIDLGNGVFIDISNRPIPRSATIWGKFQHLTGFGSFATSVAAKTPLGQAFGVQGLDEIGAEKQLAFFAKKVTDVVIKDSKLRASAEADKFKKDMDLARAVVSEGGLRAKLFAVGDLLLGMLKKDMTRSTKGVVDRELEQELTTEINALNLLVKELGIPPLVSSKADMRLHSVGTIVRDPQGGVGPIMQGWGKE